jgi:EAL domain-containing protein (putative c-di-GMP-specific phosphodiesterase class I)
VTTDSKSTTEVLCIGSDPAKLGLTESQQQGDQAFAFTLATSLSDAHKALAQPERWDLVLCSSTQLPDLGIDLRLGRVAGTLMASVIVIRAPGSQLSPSEAAEQGAADIVHPGDREHLEMVVARELESAALRKELWRLQRSPQSTSTGMPGSNGDRNPARNPAQGTTTGNDHDPRTLSTAASGRRTDAPVEQEPASGPLDDRQIKTLIERGGLTLHYQPIVALQHSDEHAGMFEVLMRLRDSKGRLLPPGRFFPAASRHQWLARLDLWVLQRTLPKLARIQATTDEATRLFINLSSETFSAPTLFEKILQHIAGSKISAGSLTFEIQPEVMRLDCEALSRLHETLSERKHGLLLERFDAGYCRLLSDNQSRITYVKLNPTIVRALAAGESELEEARQAVQCAREHGAKVIALGVENAESLADLFALGVDYMQGNFVSTPHDDLVSAETAVAS